MLIFYAHCSKSIGKGWCFTGKLTYFCCVALHILAIFALSCSFPSVPCVIQIRRVPCSAVDGLRILPFRHFIGVLSRRQSCHVSPVLSFPSLLQQRIAFFVFRETGARCLDSRQALLMKEVKDKVRKVQGGGR